MSHDIYQTPLTGRYSSPEMQKLFSLRTRYSTWRQLWVWLAEAQHELGLKEVSNEALSQMRAHVEVQDDEFAFISSEEKRVRHDVFANIHAFGAKAPAAAGIIHWGATSCYCTDNADLLFLKQGLDILLPKLARVVNQLKKFCLQYKDLPILGYTHLQPAQPVTLGKRASLWLLDLLTDLETLENLNKNLRFRGTKGTTGTQASFLAIFDGDHDKVEELDELVTKKAGFKSPLPVVSQTYSRKIDLDIINALSSFAATCEKMAGDIRHMCHWKELEEPFEKDQVGSSAMAYKRNPMRSERLSSLAKILRALPSAAADVYSTQWLERTLDDSAARRITIPDAMLGADACLILLLNITDGFVVYPAVIERNLRTELPFMATENMIMAATKLGLSRQDAHEEIRLLSMQSAEAVKRHGKENDLIERVKQSEFFKPILPQLPQLLDPKTFIGRAPQQVEKFCGPDGEVERALSKYSSVLRTDVKSDLHV